ncbi:3-keto-5-aminohexanoate cleavage protein [Chloroflexota bacterium]
MNCIINFTPTGMIPTKKMTPSVPVSIQEIIEEVLAASEIGITMVHLHARDEQSGKPTYKAEVYGKIIGGIRKFRKDLVIVVSLSGRKFSEFEKRTEVLALDGEVKPDMGSLTLSSFNFNEQVSLNSPEVIQTMAEEMKQRGILSELEVFDIGMINYAKYLERKRLLESPHYFNLIFGNITCAQSDLLHVGVMIRDLPPHSLWSLGGLGDSQLPINSIAIAMGGGVRVGLEDNIWFDLTRNKLARNSDLIRRIHRIAEENERSIMTPAELRVLLNLEPGHGHYGRNFSDHYTE